MWIAISELPADGTEVRFIDPAIWAEPIHEFGINCRVVKPLTAVVSVTRQAGEDIDGYLIRGHLTGEVIVPCNRCAEDAVAVIDSEIYTFEPLPGNTFSEQYDEDTDKLIVRFDKGIPQINLEELLWEEFSMALPVKPLCKSDCRGLCPICGHNKNYGDCGCAVDEGDPRLAALRNLKISKKV